MSRKPPKKVKTVRVSEDTIHKSVAAHLNLRCSPDCYWFHVPNGGSRNVIEATKLKAMGTKAGVADLVIIIRGKAHFLELKAKKGRMSAAQIMSRTLVEAAGAVYQVAYGIDEALGVLESWGAFVIGRPAFR